MDKKEVIGMGFIVVRRGENLMVVSETIFPSQQKEQYLHRILESEPRFVAIEEQGEPLPTVVVASKFRLSNGEQLDLLLLDSKGNFTLCELKKDKITKRTIGQILNYAAQLAEMSVSDFKREIEQAKQKLQEQIQDDWDSELFTDEALDESLKNPRLVLVGYQIEEDALCIAKWLQKHKVRVECYDFNFFHTGEIEIFVPRNLTPLDKTEDETGQRKGLLRRLEFWEDMLNRLGYYIPHRRKPTTDNWLRMGIGVKGTSIGWSGARNKLRVDLYIRKAENSRLVEIIKGKENDFLRVLKDKIGEDWYIYETEKQFYVQTTKDIGTYGSVWEAPEEIRNWGVETLVKLYNEIVPVLWEWAEENDEGEED